MVTLNISREEVSSGRMSAEHVARAVRALRTDGFVVLADVIDLDAKGPALGQGRRSGSEDRQGQESGGDAAHDRLHLNPRARGAREDCPSILKKALRESRWHADQHSGIVNTRQG